MLANWPENNWVTRCGAAFCLIGTLVIAVTSNQATLLAVENALEIYPTVDDEYRKDVRDGTVAMRVSMMERLRKALGQVLSFKPFARMFVRLSFVTLQLIVAIMLRKSPLQYMQGFMGSFGVGCLTFWAPFLIYLKMNRGLIVHRGKRYALYLFLTTGIFVSFVGMFFSASSLLGEANA